MKYLFATFALLLCSPALAQERVTPVSQTEIQLSFAPVVKKVFPAVVNIYTSRKVQVQSLSPFMGDPFFQQFFGGRQGFGGMTRERVVSSLGSGVIVDRSGMVVTSHHVIEGATDIIIALSDRREFKAKVVTADPSSDLALLQIQLEKGAEADFPSLTLIDSDTAEVGDLVLAIGNPFGVGQTVTSGIVSALARPAEGITDYNFFIQTDAAINPGNSGGALVNIRGELIGINTAIYSRSGGSNGIGFAIPANMVMALTRGGAGASVMRPWLGAEYQDVTGEIARSLGMDRPHGVLVKDVFKGSPAAEAGVKPGDVIVAIENIQVEDVQSLKYRVATAPSDKALPLKILRGGEEIETEVELTLPPESPARDARVLKGANPFEGLTVMNLSPRVAVELNLATTGKGVVVADTGMGTGARLGFQKGDLLLSLNNTPIQTTSQLEGLLKNEAYGWTIQFERGGRRLNLTVN